jgi:hypothetical protein
MMELASLYLTKPMLPLKNRVSTSVSVRHRMTALTEAVAVRNRASSIDRCDMALAGRGTEDQADRGNEDKDDSGRLNE